MSSKKPTPIGAGVEFNCDADAHQRTASRQRAAIRAAAKAIEAGRPPSDPAWIADVLRHAAEAIPLEQPREVGAAPRADHGAIVLMYGWLRVHDDLNHTRALVELEFETGITATPLAKLLTPAVRAEALRLFAGTKLIRKQGR